VTKKKSSKEETPAKGKMTDPQKRYARTRVEEIINAKLRWFRDLQVDCGDVWRAEILAGRFKIDPKALAAAYKTGASMEDVVKLVRYPKGLGELHNERVADIGRRREMMKAHGNRLIDKIMLGSGETALEAIQAFEGMTF